ncbi:hypothetical protein BD779DRAFT_1676040 [Infundibulicybe gibba]|nr:hypothetical protein BD779DRAFT_1676040 [Infundibulicybe gibba]
MAALVRRVIVDDADPQIQYSGIDQWTLLIGEPPLLDVGVASPSNGPPFQNTTHSTNATSSLSLQFRGSQPQVFGTSMDVRYECFVDDTSIGPTFEDGYIPTNNALLCDGTPFFEAKEYTLTLNVTQVYGHEMDFYFDYVTYIPSTSVPLGSDTVLVDRLDPAIVPRPETGWLISTSTSNLGSLTQTNGSSLTFNFTGTSVSWVGFTPQMPSGRPTSNATYSIDNAKPVVFRLPSGSPFDNLTNQVFFTSPTLNPGPHSLKVTYRGNNATPPLTLSHLVVANNVSKTSLQVPPVASASSQPPAVSSTAATSTNKPNASTPIGAIVGGVIGGIAVICLTAFLLWRRNRQLKISRKRSGTDTATPPHLTPFDVMPSEPAMAEASKRIPKAHHFSTVNPPEFDPYLLLDRPSGIDDVDATPRAQDLNRREPSLGVPPVETVHEDRGARSANTDEAVDPPPSYAS